MALLPLSHLLRHAKSNHYAIPAFNISFQEQAMAVLAAAEETNSPVILQFSKGGLEHASRWFVNGLLEHIKQSHLPICLHRDHCHTLSECEEAIALGFSSVMMDGSLTAEGIPNSIEDNIKITNAAISLAKPHGVSIEAELGCLGSLETGKSGEEDGTEAQGTLSTEQLLTDPLEAQRFIAETQVDCLAIAIGTSHGAYKFSKPPTENTLDICRVKNITQMIPETPLVLHGSSSVPQTLCQSINTHGGHIPSTFGVPVEAIQQAIPYSVAKVNIDTDLRLACTAAIRSYLVNNPGEIDPRKYLNAGLQAMKSICIERYRAFGASQQATALMKTYDQAHTTTV